MAINPDFFADFSALAGKPRAHEMHPPGATSKLVGLGAVLEGSIFVFSG